MTAMKTLRVFLASPGDLEEERRAFVAALKKLNRGWGSRHGTRFEPLTWEGKVIPAGPRSQAVINELIEACDVFILALYKRWGQAAPDSGFSSFTEEEFQTAVARLVAAGQAPINIFVFLKALDREDLADPGPQLEQVLRFRRELERTHTFLPRYFASVGEFEELLQTHLVACAQGVTSQEVLVERMPLRSDLVARVEAAQSGAGTSGESEALELARQAAMAAGEGRIEEARQKFARVTGKTVNGEALFLAFDFYRRVGDETAMEDVLKLALAYYGPDEENENTASALAQLGMLFLERGDLEQARRLQEKSLKINEKLGSLKGIADQYCRLGIVHSLEPGGGEAENFFRESERLNRQIDRARGLSFTYRNWARWRYVEEDYESAEHLIGKAIRLDREPGRARQLAWGLRLLGDVCQELDRTAEAIDSYREAQAQFESVNDLRAARACRREIEDLC